MIGQDEREIDEIIGDLISNMTPDTLDKKILEKITVGQLVDLSYQENVIPRNASLANYIVPQGLFNLKLNQVWRYPPYMEFDFEIINKNENPKMSIKMGFGIPRYLCYKEHRQMGNHASQIEISLRNQINVPSDFYKVNVFNKTYDLKDQNSINRRSVSPQFFTLIKEINVNDLTKGAINFPFSIQSSDVAIKQYDENTGQIQVATENEGLISSSFNGRSQAPNPRVASIWLRNGEINGSLSVSLRNELDGKCFLSIKIVNNTLYNPSGPTDRNWLSQLILCPYIIICTDDFEYNLGFQQHEEIRRQTLFNETSVNSPYSTYMQTNGVLTQSPLNKKCCIGTMFGVFDLLRDEPINYDKTIIEMVESDNSLLSCFPEKLASVLRDNRSVMDALVVVLKSIKDGFNVEKLYKYQWTAIQNRIEIILLERHGTATVIKAPTGSGKTIVFMANAALNYLITKERAALVFPTRILNEDMFKRLTHFIYHLRRNGADITGGIYIGTSDPLYQAIASPKPGLAMIQYSTCPNCKNEGVICAIQQGGRNVGKCTKCEHVIDYMFGVKEVGDYLPSLVIATPDKLFYDITTAGWEEYNFRMIGGYYIRCTCGKCIPAMWSGDITCKDCNKTLSRSNIESSPLMFFVFDEVHSLYGETGSLLSIFLKSLQVALNRIRNPRGTDDSSIPKFNYETGTATIANEMQLVSEITRADPESIKVLPDNAEFDEYFILKPNRVRYRTMVVLPVATSARNSVAKSIYYQNKRINSPSSYKTNLVDEIKDIGGRGTEYDFSLDYVFKKKDGYAQMRAINDLARTENYNLSVKFLSGDSNARDIAEAFNLAQRNEINVLVANMVMSLGIDIKNLNNIIALGVTQNMTEHVQTAGRTGRGDIPGHVTFHLIPSYPRDQFVYENFYSVLGDISGFYDKYPIQATNAYASQIIFPNILKMMMAATSYYNYMLKTKNATICFSRNDGAKQLLQLDILKCLIHTTTPTSIKKQINELTQRELERLIQKFSQYSSSNRKISEVLGQDDELLFTLRARTGKEIVLKALESSLYEKMLNKTKSQFSQMMQLDTDELEEEDD